MAFYTFGSWNTTLQQNNNIPMNKYGLHGHLKASQGNGDKLAEILLKAAALVSKAKGCHLYIISREPEETDTIWITEIWDSKEDHDHSLKADEVRLLIGQAMPLLDGMPQGGQVLDILGGFGIKNP